MSNKTPKTNAAQQQSATITLRANGHTLTLNAVRKSDGSAITYAVTRDAEKKSSRGMTETHANIDAAKAHLAKLAEQATKAGWKRGVFAAPGRRADAFSKIPQAPKASAAEAVQR